MGTGEILVGVTLRWTPQLLHATETGLSSGRVGSLARVRLNLL